VFIALNTPQESHFWVVKAHKTAGRSHFLDGTGDGKASRQV